MTAAASAKLATEDMSSSDSEGDSLDFTAPLAAHETKDL
jgi:hypothetical protein